MKKNFYLLPAFLLSTIQVFGQYYEMTFNANFKPDKQLKEVWEYKVEEKDSSLRSKDFYSEGLLQSTQIFFKDTLRKEILFKYDENQLLSLVSEYYKDVNKKDTAKSIVWYLYDQYKNPYFEKRGDSVPYGDFNIETRQQFFTSYVYQDSLIIFSNLLSEIPGMGFHMETKKFEYNKKKQLCKTFVHQMTDTVGYFRLAEELFYDEKGNHIKTILYCIDYTVDNYGNKIKTPCENDLLTYTYNSKNQLVGEFHHYHGMFFQNDNIKYVYDSKGRLQSVCHTMEQDKKYITNHYFKY